LVPPRIAPGIDAGVAQSGSWGSRAITRIVGEMSAAGAHLNELSKRGPCPARAAVVR